MKKGQNGAFLGIPSRKLGVKYLDDNQINNTFPDWKALLERIKEQRKVAEIAYENDFIPKDIRFPQTYDNLFAILGGRGSGKSSAILTLRSKMESPDKKDILLPIITPEILSEQECSILGWIMSATEMVLCNLENDIRLLRERCGYDAQLNPKLDDFFKDCRFREQNTLRKCYEDLFEKSIGVSKNFQVSGYSAEDAVLYGVKQSRRQYKLIQDINAFWKLLSDTWYAVRQDEKKLPCARYCKQNDQIQKKTEYPLIVLMFDDIDLVPERSMELLTTTFQYFTNPNIVIIITAAPNILQDVIYLKMFERMVGSQSGSLLTDALPWKNFKTGLQNAENKYNGYNPIEKIAQEFFDKVIPPSSRYQLRRYKNLAEKELYSYSSMEQTFLAPYQNQKVGISIKDFLLRQVEELIDHFAPQKQASLNFLLGGTNKNVFQKAYLIMFGEKSRNIENGCLEIINTFDRLKNIPKDPNSRTPKDSAEVLMALRHLVRALLVSKKTLKEYAEEVDSIIQLLNTGGCYIDYNAVAKFYDEERKILKNWVVSEYDESSSQSWQSRMESARKQLKSIKTKFVCFMTILFFTEGVLKILYPQWQSIHGYRQLQYILNSDVIFEETGYNTHKKILFPQQFQTEKFLHNFGSILDHLEDYVDFDLYDLETAKKYLSDIFLVQVMQEKIAPVEVLYKEVERNYSWVKNILSMLILRYSGIVVVQPALIEIPDNIRATFELFSFTNQFLDKRKKEIQLFFTQNNLVHPSSERLHEFFKIVTKDPDVQGFKTQWKENPFFKQTTDSLFARNNEYSRFVNDSNPSKECDSNQNDAYIKWYLACRWNVYTEYENEKNIVDVDSTDSNNLCYTLVRFFEDTLANLSRVLTTQTSILLTASKLEDTIKKLDSTKDTSLIARQKREACILILQQVLDRDPVYINSSEDGLEHIWYEIPAQPLIEYLIEVQKNLLSEEKRMSQFAFFDNFDIKNYLELCRLLVVHYLKSDQKITMGGVEIPMASMLISELKMLEFLLPYYLAAHMQGFVNSYYYSEILPFRFNGNDKWKKSLDGKLQELFETLTAEKLQNKKYTHLHDLMEQVQTEVAENYYRYLEAFHE